MRPAHHLFSLALCALVAAACSPGADTGRVRDFNAGWRFQRESLTEAAPLAGAQAPDYDDAAWTAVTLPHDFAILPLPGGDSDDQIGPFNKASPGGGHTGYTMGGVGWYRKTFTLPAADEGKQVSLLLDGAYMETQVWVNGRSVGSNLNGYTPFALDITSALRPTGEANVVAIRVENPGRNSRWYTGAGLYRDVRLVVTPPMHVATWGVYVTTPQVSDHEALVNVQVTVDNAGHEQTSADVCLRLIGPGGQVAAQAQAGTVAVDAGASATISGEMRVAQPALWSPNSPALYTAEVSLMQQGRTVDTYTQTVGIRSLEVTADKGLLINGESVLLWGGCIHHDHGLLGAPAIRAAERRKVKLLHDHGYNAIRCSHNPPSQHFLDACDELGMLVIDEFTDMWTIAKNVDDYSRHFEQAWDSDLTRMMLRDRNHPSVIMWSIGNEIPRHSVADGVRIGTMLRDRVRQLDPTRPVTEGVTGFLLQGGWEQSSPYFNLLDVGGYNYLIAYYEADHELYPDRVMYASELVPQQVYGSWDFTNRHPYVIGGFVWTAMDYIGETQVGSAVYKPESEIVRYNAQMRIGLPDDFDPAGMMLGMSEAGATTAKWPNYVSWCGDLDLIGQPKPQMLYRDVVWGRSPVEINAHEPIPAGMAEDISFWGWPREYPSWNWNVADGTPMQVRVFAPTPTVRLELNGELIGEKTLTEADQYTAEFTVPYQAGTLTAIALRADGTEAGRRTLTTTGQAAALRLTAECDHIAPGTDDLAYVLIEAVDAEGRVSYTRKS